MPEELFDVVNTRDDVVGCRPRREVHQLGLLHRAVHVLISNSKGRIFLQKRSMRKDCSPGLWDSSSSGHLDAGEGYDVAALREVAEELGCQLVAPLVRCFKVDACEETGMEFVWVYQTTDEGPFTLNRDELESGDWFMPEEITRWVRSRPEEFAQAFLLIWHRLSVRGGGGMKSQAEILAPLD